MATIKGSLHLNSIPIISSSRLKMNEEDDLHINSQKRIPLRFISNQTIAVDHMIIDHMII